MGGIAVAIERQRSKSPSLGAPIFGIDSKERDLPCSHVSRAPLNRYHVAPF